MADKDQNQNLEDSTSLDEDLEEYGVWVKAGPEDVDENEGESLFGLADLDEAEETTLTSEEEDLLADLEESEPEAESEPGDSESIESLDLESDDLSLDDLDLPEPSFEDDLADLSLDQEEPAERQEEPEEATVEGTSDESLDSLLEDEGLDLEGIPGSEQDDFEDLVIEEDEEPAGSEDLPELEYEEEQPTFDAETSLDEIELEEPVFGDEETESIELDGEPLPSPESLEEDFDDISAVEASMTAPVSEPVSAEGQNQSQADGRVLATIEEELASIKTELHQLRAELASFRGGHPEAPEARPIETPLPEEGEEVTGFFDEDEDETIALTGDELDNILNTAEFTEEAGKPSDYEDFDLAADFEDSDILGEGEDLIPDSMEPAEPDVEEHTEVAAVDLDLGGFEHEPDEESPIEEITLEDLEEEAGGAEDFMIGSEDTPALELPDEETFGGDDEDVAALAEMDIESELAGIDELKDEPDTEEISFEAEEIEEDEISAEPADEDAIEIDLSGIDEGEVSEPEELGGETDLIEEEIEEEIVEDIDLPEEAAAESSLPADLKGEIRSVLSYMDQLLEALPEDKIEEFARSEHFEVYKRLFEELGLEQR